MAEAPKKANVVPDTARHLLPSVRPIAGLKLLGVYLLLFLCSGATAQICTVINSVPATPPKSGKFDMLVAAPALGYYSWRGSRIYDQYDINGIGSYTQIDTNKDFWRN